MLKNRIIVTLLHDGKANAVKPVSFGAPRPVGSLAQHVKVQAERDIDELILIDINATREKRTINFDRIAEYASDLYCPLTVGGNIHSLEDIRAALNYGADKVILKNALLKYPRFVKEASKKYGAQCLVAAMDWPDKLTPYDYNVRMIERLGVGEICFTSTTRDGKMEGYNIKSLTSIIKCAKVPVIANGGCGSVDDMHKALRIGASAVAASSLFLYTDITPRECAEELARRGCQVRTR